ARTCGGSIFLFASDLPGNRVATPRSASLVLSGQRLSPNDLRDRASGQSRLETVWPAARPACFPDFHWKARMVSRGVQHVAPSEDSLRRGKVSPANTAIVSRAKPLCRPLGRRSRRKAA